MGGIYGPSAPAGPPDELPQLPWEAPGGPGHGSGAGDTPGKPARRPRHGRAVVVALICALVLGAALGTAWVLHTARATPRKSAPLRTSAAAVAALVDPGVVDVVSTLGYQDAMSAGTGLVLTASGEVLTNNHVIEGATSVKVTDIGNGRTYQAVVVGYDQAGDIAILQLRGASGLKAVTLGVSSKVTVGEKVIALGNANGKGGRPAATTGTVTGLDEAITATDEAQGTSEHLTGLIRTNAALQAGDSGGPLVSTGGTVIGMDTAATTGFQFQPGATEGFAIPVGRAVAVARQIEAGRSSATAHIGPTGFLGVQVALAMVPFTSRTEVVIVGTMAGLPAASAGLAAGDVIVSIDGHAVASPSGLQALLEPHHPGDKISISWQDPSGQAHSATVRLATGPAG